MGFSTYITTVDRCLRRTGQATWAGNTEFNANNGQEIQVQAKDIVDEVNRRFLRLSRNRFLRRTFTITTADGDNAYDGPTDATAERFQEGTWRITAPAASAKQPLLYKPYDEWTTQYPNGETVEGTPSYWGLLPRTSSDKDEIFFSPPPDATYTIKFEYYLGPYVLSQATDLLVWPTHVEDLLWAAACLDIEGILAEGKSMEIRSKVDEIFSEIEQLCKEPTDAPSRVDLGIEIDTFRPYRLSEYFYD